MNTQVITVARPTETDISSLNAGREGSASSGDINVKTVNGERHKQQNTNSTNELNAALLSDLLIKVGKEKDKQAFSALFDHFAPRIESFLKKRNAAPEVAEDLVQDVMLTVWRKADMYERSKAAASTWIFTVARNRYIDRIRRHSKPQLDANEPMLQPDAPDDGEKEAFRDAICRDVQTAINELPQDQLMVVRLSFEKGMAHSEIAEALNLPLGTVKSRMRLAFAKLRGSLEDWK